MEPKSRQEGMLRSPVLSLWLPWSYFSRLLRSCIGTVGLFSLPRPHRIIYNIHNIHNIQTKLHFMKDMIKRKLRYTGHIMRVSSGLSHLQILEGYVKKKV